jgi:hypothetical protein
MEKKTKVWLVLAIITSVYMIYIIGVSATIVPGHADNHFFLNLFNVNNINSAANVLNWTTLLSLVLWLIWGFSYVREDNK